MRIAWWCDLCLGHRSDSGVLTGPFAWAWLVRWLIALCVVVVVLVALAAAASYSAAEVCYQ
jgi:hypothetical protein